MTIVSLEILAAIAGTIGALVTVFTNRTQITGWHDRRRRAPMPC